MSSELKKSNYFEATGCSALLSLSDMKTLQSLSKPGMPETGAMLQCSNPKAIPDRKGMELAGASKAKFGARRNYHLKHKATRMVACRKCPNCEAKKRKQKGDRHYTEVLAWPAHLCHMVTLTKNNHELSLSYTTAQPAQLLDSKLYKKMRRQG